MLSSRILLARHYQTPVGLLCAYFHQRQGLPHMPLGRLPRWSQAHVEKLKEYIPQLLELNLKFLFQKM